MDTGVNLEKFSSVQILITARHFMVIRYAHKRNIINHLHRLINKWTLVWLGLPGESGGVFLFELLAESRQVLAQR